MSKVRVAINGFGRIGRAAFKIIQERRGMEVVAINDLADAKTLAHLLKYDTAYGAYDRTVSAVEGNIVFEKKKIPVLAEKEPAKLPWGKLKIDVVLECTGKFVKDGAAKQHLAAGARRVIVSAPTKGGGDVKSFLLGVNQDDYRGEAVVSNASCTTNCLAPVAKVIHDGIGIKKAMMSTIHSYTADQNLQDAPHKDLRRARAAAQNIVPTSTGAAVSVTEVIPALRGKFDGLAIRVPTITASLTDFTFLVARPTSADEINNLFRQAAKQKRWQGILAVTDDPIVSSDVIGSAYSAIVDLGLTRVVDSDLVKVLAWYDNEWGYACRLVDQTALVAK